MIELLAPVGSNEALIAAIEGGANAIYLGGKAFGARHYAPNFTDEELAAAVRFAHLRGVSVFVTVNTLVDDSEIPALADYLRHLYSIGVDAIIVQDLGVAAIARQVTPDLEIHASTQMTVHNLEGVKFLAAQGFARVVLAREVSLDDIAFICKNSPVEIEIFIHGALCISYSGQCLMSSMIGGRSGNRGKCAQPCRLPYALVDRDGRDVLAESDAGQYLLSPKDLNTIELIPELIERGVASFKIEGRMKRPEYVAVVVDTYRRAIDAYQSNKADYVVTEDMHKDLGQVFNRDFTTAYLEGKKGRFMMSDRRPNNRGIRIGRVLKYDYEAKTATIRLDEPLTIGDMVEFWVKVGGRVSTSVTVVTVKGKEVSEANAGMEVTIPVSSPVRVNDRVFKTFDAKLMNKARVLFTSGAAVRRIPVDVEATVTLGQPLTLKMTDAEGYIGIGQTEFLAQQALKRPLTDETIAKQVDRLGTTIFVLRSLTCHINGELMVPISEINEARRKAVEMLEEARLSRYSRPMLKQSSVALPPVRSIAQQKPELMVNVDTVEKVQAALNSGADWILFGGETFHHRPLTADDYQKVVGLCHSAGKKVCLATPRLVKEWQMHAVQRDLALFAEIKPDAIMIANLGIINLVRSMALPVYGDYTLNAFNSITIEFLRNQGLSGITLSPELNFGQIENLSARSRVDLECIVHGHLTLMVSEYCAVGSFLGQLQTGQCNQACLHGRYLLKDRMNETFPVVTDQYCRMHILNAKELSLLPHTPKFGSYGIRRIRIEGKLSEPVELARTVKLYRELLDQGERHLLFKQDNFSSVEHTDITRGHYFRGVI